jgi:hypothetical protein
LTDHDPIQPDNPEQEIGEDMLQDQPAGDKSVERPRRSTPQGAKRPRITKKKDDPNWQYQSVLERIIEKKIKLKDYATEPKRLLLWVGIQLAKFWRRGGREPRREERLLLGKESMCCVYPRWWFDDHGDYRLIRECGYVQKHPDLLGHVKEHPDYDQRCRDKVEELKHNYQKRKEECADARTNPEARPSGQELPPQPSE